MLKFCKKCNAETERYPNGQCRPCGRISRKKSVAKWRAANPEKVRAGVVRTLARLKEERAAKREATREERERMRTEKAAAAKERAYARNRTWQANNKDKVRALDKAWRTANPDKIRALVAKQVFKNNGWTPERFEQAWVAQEGRCAVCTRALTRVWRGRDAVFADHDHETRQPRRLLCRNCNTGIGLFKDNPSLLREAALYLETAHD